MSTLVMFVYVEYYAPSDWYRGSLLLWLLHVLPGVISANFHEDLQMKQVRAGILDSRNQ